MDKLAAMRSKGFSLVELLVSTVLLSAIVLLASYAYAQFSQYWDGRLGKFDETYESLRKEWLVDQLFGDITPYVVMNSRNLPVYYFEGNVNGFVAVTTNALSEPGVPAVVRLSLRQSTDFSFDLLLEEAPMRSSELETLVQTPNFSEPVTVLKDLRDAEFSYFGSEALVSGDDTSTSPASWRDAYNSAVTQQHPIKLRLWFRGPNGARQLTVDLTQPWPGQLSSRFDQDLGL